MANKSILIPYDKYQRLLASNNEETKMPCAFCKETFGRKDVMKRHILSKHRKEFSNRKPLITPLPSPHRKPSSIQQRESTPSFLHSSPPTSTDFHRTPPNSMLNQRGSPLNSTQLHRVPRDSKTLHKKNSWIFF